MNTSRFHIASLVLAAIGGLTAAPTRAADATLGDLSAVAMAEAEHWPLRPTKVPAGIPMSPRSKAVAVSELPNGRRPVRVVYQGYGEAVPAPTR